MRTALIYAARILFLAVLLVLGLAGTNPAAKLAILEWIDAVFGTHLAC